jgi:hypothetical protein
MVCLPIRYADDFVVLVQGSREQAEAEKDALAEHLRSTLGLELSAEKTRITPIQEGFDFLGHCVRLKWDRYRGSYTSLEIPKEKTQRLRLKIKRLTRRGSTGQSLASMLRRLNSVLRRWAYFYRHCYGAKRVFSPLDWYTGERIYRWLRKKHLKTGAKKLLARYRRRSPWSRRKIWSENGAHQFTAASLTVERYRLAWMSLPDFAKTLGEPDA